MKKIVLTVVFAVGIITATFGQMGVNEKRMMRENETEFKNMYIFVEINNMDKNVNKDELHEEHAKAYFEFWTLVNSKVDEKLLHDIELNNIVYIKEKNTYLTNWKNIMVEYNKTKM